MVNIMSFHNGIKSKSKQKKAPLFVLTKFSAHLPFFTFNQRSYHPYSAYLSTYDNLVFQYTCVIKHIF